jgi:hypothetical protein
MIEGDKFGPKIGPGGRKWFNFALLYVEIA